MTEFNLKEEPDLGYIFFSTADDDGLGFPRFDVIMREHPTNNHFDPLSVNFWMKTNATIEHMTIHHPSRDGHQYKILPSRIIIRDRKKKEVEVFSFGADLHVSSEKERTICIFTSPVPMLHLMFPESAATHFANEVEGLLAQYKAHLGRDYEVHLARIEPTVLYATCLDAIQEKLTQLPPVHTGTRHELEQWIPGEIARLNEAGLRPTPANTLEDLFAL